MGRNLLSLQHFLHTPNSLQLPLKTMHHAAHSGTCIPYQSPRVFCAPLECPCGALSSATPCTPGQFTKSLHMHTSLTAIFPMDGAPLCAHHTPFPSTFCQFSHTQELPHMFQILSHSSIWMQLPISSPTSWSDPASTLAPEALL